MRWLVLVSVLGCGSKPAPPSPDVIALCDSLDRNQCLDSTQCTLVQVQDTQYACRPEQGSCESGLKQDNKAACEQRSGCRFEPADCFCACKTYGRTKIEDVTGEDCKCGCGGGKPSMCVSKDTPRSEDP